MECEKSGEGDSNYAPAEANGYSDMQNTIPEMRGEVGGTR